MTPFGLPVFDGLSALSLAGLFLTYAGAFAIKGIFGYGAIPPVILMGSLVMPPHHAVILGGLVNFASQGVLIPDGLQSGNRPLAGRIILFMVPTLVLGVWIFAALDPRMLQLALGLTLLGILLVDGPKLRALMLPLVERHGPLFSAGAACIAGLMAGVVGAGAMIFLSVYLQKVEPDRLTLRGTIILIVSAMLIWRTTLLVSAGLVTWSHVAEAAFLLPVAIASLKVGQYVAHRMSNAAFFRAYRVFMIAASLMLVVRGIA